MTVQSTQDDQGTLLVGGGSQAIVVKRGQNCFHLSLTATDAPLATFAAELVGCKDTLPENNKSTIGVLVRPKPRLLLVESRPASAAQLAAALQSQAIDVHVCSPQDMPATADGIQRYDAVILSNVPAASLPAARMELIRNYVRDFGGGLIAVGGDQSFTPGGYHDSAIEEILPVWSEAKKDKPKPTLAMVLVLDVSGSMEGKSIDLAKQATRRAVEMLGPRDLLGVIAFEEKSWWVSPLHTCTDKDKILRQVAAISAGGETEMYPPLDKAYLALRESFADLKHIIVMTDGVSSPGDFDGLAKNIAATGITVSTVAIGDEAAGPLLQEIAERAKGHYYFCDDMARVPQIFALDTSIAGKLGISEEPFSPKPSGASAIFGDLDLQRLPTLLGCVETRPKEGSQLVLASQGGDPLLVVGHYGRGTSVAFNSDIQSRWAAAWLHWPDFGKFWVRLVRAAMRKEPPHSSAPADRAGWAAGDGDAGCD